MKNPIIRARIPDFGTVDAVQLKIQQIEAEMIRQQADRATRYCTRIIEYCDKSIKLNR